MTTADLATVRAELAACEPTLTRRGVCDCLGGAPSLQHFAWCSSLGYLPLTGTALGAALIELCYQRGLEVRLHTYSIGRHVTLVGVSEQWTAMGDTKEDALALAYHAATKEGA